jgi:hypothetical protein
LAGASLAERLFREVSRRLDDQELALDECTRIDVMAMEADATRLAMTDDAVCKHDLDIGSLAKSAFVWLSRRTSRSNTAAICCGTAFTPRRLMAKASSKTVWSRATRLASIPR